MMTVLKKLLATLVAFASNGCFWVTRKVKLKTGIMFLFLSVNFLTTLAQSCYPTPAEEKVSKTYANYPNNYHQQGHWLRTNDNLENETPVLIPEKMRRIFNDYPIYRDWKILNVPFNKNGKNQDQFSGSVSL